jgi:hypothetical protein
MQAEPKQHVVRLVEAPLLTGTGCCASTLQTGTAWEAALHTKVLNEKSTTRPILHAQHAIMYNEACTPMLQ